MKLRNLLRIVDLKTTKVKLIIVSPTNTTMYSTLNYKPGVKIRKYDECKVEKVWIPQSDNTLHILFMGRKPK